MPLDLKSRFKKKKADAGAAPEAETPGKIRPVRSTRGPKFVLFIGDEGAILLYIKGNEVLSRQFVPDASAPHLAEFSQTFAQDTLAPVMMVVDSVDQTYVPQTLPPVSSMSVGKLIKRRLDRDFGANDIKGAILLGREKSGRKDWNFLMISVEKSAQITAWLDFVSELPNRFRGIHLVSVETEILVKKLERAMGLPKEGTGSEWKFFVSHNKVGGFRQVILRNGRLIFTRLSQPLGEANPEVIAGNLEQEMLSTIEYMRRLGFAQEAGLDVIIVASRGVKDSLDRAKFNASSFHVMTPFEMAQYFGIEGATQPTDQFGDVVLAASIGCTRKRVLTLSTPMSRKLDAYYQMVYYQRLFAILGVFGLVCFALTTAYSIYNQTIELEDQGRKKASAQQALIQLQSDIAKSNIDVEKADDLIDLYQQLLSERHSPLPMLEKVRLLVQAPMRIKSFEWMAGEKAGNGAAGKQSQAVNPMAFVFTVEFPAVANNPALFKTLSGKLLADFKTAFPPPYDVTYSKLPQQAEDTGKVEINFDERPPETQKLETGKGPEAEMTIIGELVQPAVVTTGPLIPSQ